MILLNNDLNTDIDVLKLKATLMSRNMQFSHENAEKLKEILLNDQLSTLDFINKFNTLIETSQPKGWKMILLLNHLKDRFTEKIAIVSAPMSNPTNPELVKSIGIVLHEVSGSYESTT